jgi:hypothetical protein
MLSYLSGGSARKYIGFGAACGCCGASGANHQSPRKWKNQHGEGVVSGQEINPITQNYNGILLVGGKAGESGNFGKIRVDHVKTKNGVLTVSVQERW